MQNQEAQTQDNSLSLEALQADEPVEKEASPTEGQGGEEEIKKSLESQPKELTAEEEPAKAPDYVPDFKYKVYGQEKEMPESVRSLIKSKEDEEYFRDLFTKADGVEAMKAHREHYRKQFNELQSEVSKVLDMTEKGDLAGALSTIGWNPKDIAKTAQALGWDKRQIIEYAYQLANLTPEQEQYQNQLRQAEQEKLNLAKQQQQLQTQLEQFQVQTRQAELQSALSSPEVAPIKEAYDKIYGPDAFEHEVIKEGQWHFYARKVDMPVQQVVREILERARRIVQPQSQQQVSTPQVQPTPQRREDLPVIPAMGSGSSRAPVSKKVTSIEEMKRIAQTLSD